MVKHIFVLAFLSLGCIVTVSGLISQCQTSVSVCNQPPRSTQAWHCFCIVFLWRCVDGRTLLLMTGLSNHCQVDALNVPWYTGRRNFGFGFSARCGVASTFGRPSVSAESSRPTFGTFSVSAWCELYFCWSPKVSQKVSKTFKNSVWPRVYTNWWPSA